MMGLSGSRREADAWGERSDAVDERSDAGEARSDAGDERSDAGDMGEEKGDTRMRFGANRRRGRSKVNSRALAIGNGEHRTLLGGGRLNGRLLVCCWGRLLSC